MWKNLKVLLALALCGAGAARADAIDDLTAGNGLRFLFARARLDGTSFTAGDWLLPKAPGTLNLALPLSHFGLPSSAVVTFAGRREPGSRVVWSFDTTLSPPLVSGATRIHRVWGQLVAEARLVAPTTACSGAACTYNVELRAAPGSAIHVHGCQEVWPACWGFDRDIDVAGFFALGGFPPVRLNAMSVALAASRCASSAEVSLAGTVRLQQPAPAAGATVQVRSSHPDAHVRPVWVRPGERTGRFTVTLEAGFASSATITASSGGVSSSVVVDRTSCPSLAWPSWATLLPKQHLYRFLLDDGRVVARAANTDLLLEPKSQQAFDLSSHLQLAEARVSAVSPAGELIGTTKSGDAFVWNIAQDLPLVVKGASPVTVNPLGLGLARSLQSGALAFVDASGVLPAPKLQGVEVTRARGNASGRFAVGLVVNSKVFPGVLDDAGAQVLVQREGEAVEVLASGQVLGFALDAANVQRAFRVLPGHAPVWLPLPSGCTAVTVSAANESGWLAGSASCGKAGTRAWLADPAGSVKLLDALVNVSGITPREVLGLNANNVVLARGDDPQGAPVFFLLQP